MKRDDLDEPASKRDLLAMEKRIGSTVGELIADALQLVSDQFTTQNKVLAQKADKADIIRIENKLNPTVDQVDDHSRSLKQLETGLA